MKTLLIVGAGREQLPAIVIARNMGVRVVATDRDPMAPGRLVADKFEIVSTADVAGNIEVARRESIDGVMTLTSETAVPVVAKVAEALGLPGIGERAAYLATNKIAMRTVAEMHKIPVPKWRAVRSLSDAMTFAKAQSSPCVVKPSDSSGQRGVSLVSRIEDLRNAVEAAITFSGDSSAIIEEYIAGPEINVTAIAHTGEVRILSLSHRVTAPVPSFGIAICHVAPVELPQVSIDHLAELAAQSVRSIGLNEGVAYPQIIVGRDGPRLVEIAARIPGGHMRDVAMLQSGVDLIRVAILQALAKPFEFGDVCTESQHPAVIVRFITQLDLPAKIKTVKCVSGIENALTIPGVLQTYVWLKPGDQVPELRSSGSRFGAIIAVGQSIEEARTRAEAARQCINIAGTL